MRHLLPSLRLTLLLLCALPSLATAAEDVARARVRQAAEAMGGEARLRALAALRLSGIGHRNLVEQSERPEGPWAALYEQREELRDLKGGRWREQSELRSSGVGAAEWRKGPALVVADGLAFMLRDGKAAPAGPAPLQGVEEKAALGPERVLLTALDAADLKSGRDEVLQGVPHHVVTFHWRKAPVRLLLNAHTHLPTAVEWVAAQPYTLMLNMWGDLRTRTLFSQWMLLPGGLRYPYQWDVERNGLPWQSFNVTSLEVDPALPPDAFDVPADVRAAAAARKAVPVEEMPLGRPDAPAVELAEGVVQLPGAWNVALVRQEDGVVVLEAPIASGYSARVLEEAARRFPGVPVKAVVSTSDAWPHLGGVREYVARGIPVYVLDLNRPIVERLLASPHTQVPDALARAPRRARLHVVSKRTALGEGDNRLELVPVRGEGSERMMMVALPGRRLLYGTDLVQEGQSGGFFMPQYLSELVDAVAREGLSVERVFAMHLGPTPWEKVVAAVRGTAPVAAPASP